MATSHHMPSLKKRTPTRPRENWSWLTKSFSTRPRPFEVQRIARDERK